MDAVIFNPDRHLTARALAEGFALGEAMKFLGRLIECGTNVHGLMLLLMKPRSPLWDPLEREAGPFPPTGEARLLVRQTFLAPLLAESCEIPAIPEDAEATMFMVLSSGQGTSVYGMALTRIEPPATPESELN